MVATCSAYNCSSRKSKGSDIGFFLFPLNHQNLLRKWLEAIRRKDFKPTRNSRICEKHFLPEEIDRRETMIKLKKGAVPSIFDFDTIRKKGTKKKMDEEDEDEIIPTKKSKRITQSAYIRDIAATLRAKNGYTSIERRKVVVTIKPKDGIAGEHADIETQTEPISTSTKSTSAEMDEPDSRQNEVTDLKNKLRDIDDKYKEMLDLAEILKNSTKKVSRYERNCIYLDRLIENPEPMHRDFGFRYPDYFKEFAMDVYTKSPHVYMYLQSVLPLPYFATVREWRKKFRDGKPHTANPEAGPVTEATVDRSFEEPPFQCLE